MIVNLISATTAFTIAQSALARASQKKMLILDVYRKCVRISVEKSSTNANIKENSTSMSLFYSVKQKEGGVFRRGQNSKQINIAKYVSKFLINGAKKVR